jgi:hypothetical protein
MHVVSNVLDIAEQPQLEIEQKLLLTGFRGHLWQIRL